LVQVWPHCDDTAVVAGLVPPACTIETFPGGLPPQPLCRSGLGLRNSLSA